ncbi:hypothetical protein MNBD_GAMMA26-2644 [hydrothermal vent metagenome]|uniref:WCX domain-containing protein n=1 Tax=hydrothermal vent metagenome TaxID=652676 RepID=A0A3B1AN38_9ZZZZ
MLLFNQQRGRYIEKEQWHPKQQGEWQGESYQLSISYHNPTELIMDILKYGSDVEVIAPESLRQAVREEIEKMQEKYEKNQGESQDLRLRSGITTPLHR